MLANSERIPSVRALDTKRLNRPRRTNENMLHACKNELAFECGHKQRCACLGENFIISMFKSLAVYRPNRFESRCMAHDSHGCRLDSILRLAGNVACMGTVDWAPNKSH